MNEIPFGFKSTGKLWIQSDFGLTQQESEAGVPDRAEDYFTHATRKESRQMFLCGKELHKNIICAKTDCQINANLPCKFGHCWRKFNFLRIFLDLLDAHNSKTQYDVTWFFSISSVSAHCASFMSKIATSEGGGGGLHILSWETTPYCSDVLWVPWGP